ncbi:MAG: hypothetical protein ACLPWF_03330 [Bryobacteraceae bacterium]
MSAVIPVGGRRRGLASSGCESLKGDAGLLEILPLGAKLGEHLVDVHYLAGYVQKGHATSMAQDPQLPLKPKMTLAAKICSDVHRASQQYSIDNQTDTIRRYAREYNLEIVRTYTDSGKNGLTIHLAVLYDGLFLT